MNIGVIDPLRTTNIDTIFDPLYANGLTTCQLNIWDTTMYTDDIAARINRQIERTGIQPCALWAGYCRPTYWNFTQGPQTLGLVPREWRERRLVELMRGADFAKKVGVRAIITHAGFLPENICDKEYMPVVRTLRTLAEYCDKLGLGFWFETGQETPVVLLRYIEEIGTGNLGINLDPANLLMYGKGNPIDALDVFGKYVHNVHVKDGMVPTDGQNLGRAVQVGQGMVNYPVFIRKLRDIGFDEELIIEREIADGPERTHDILETIDNLKKWWNA